MTTANTSAKSQTPSDLSFDLFRKAIAGDGSLTSTLKAAAEKDTKANHPSALAAIRAEIEGGAK